MIYLLLVQFTVWCEHRTFLELFYISAKEQTLRDPSGGLALMPKLAVARKVHLFHQNSVPLHTWSLGLFIGFLMLLESAKDLGSLGIHDLLPESLRILSFLSSNEVFLKIRDLSSILDFQGLSRISKP
jgi:hypothetical protein